MKIRIFLISIFLLSGKQMIFAQSKRVQNQFNRTMSIQYKTDDYDLETVDFKTRAQKSQHDDQFYKVKVKGSIKGFVYWGIAPSKERDFDYLLFFDTDLEIIKAKILMYREQFGREITDSRWLKQFVGLTPKSSVKFKENIDGISGATISARSMSSAVNQVLQTLHTLQQNNDI